MKKLTLSVIVSIGCAATAVGADHAADQKLDAALRYRAHAPQGTSRVIVQTRDGVSADALIRSVHGKPGRQLRLLGAQVAVIPDTALEELANRAAVQFISLDRRVTGTLERTGSTVGATWVRENLGYDGAGVGVAVVDSGVTPWHDDLGTGRVVHFADFVNYQATAYDDYGHGTHVAGIIAGSGYDSSGRRRGMAPGASLVVLKVLDGSGNGYISNVIAALDYAIQNRAAFNIRVVNLSVAAGVYDSYKRDPLTLAAKRAVDAGIVVVTAAGNHGRNSKGELQYGGITAPGNAPWVLTVGASSHMGTPDRSDDTIASFSSRGPTYIDYAAKPDIVAPGVGIESLADASSLLFASHASSRLWGTVPTVSQPYLSLSGTSMAAPVVAGTVALMLQANPSLTPNGVKAILQYTAEARSGYNALTQGAGFLNSRGAVELAQQFSSAPSVGYFSPASPAPAGDSLFSMQSGGGAYLIEPVTLTASTQDPTPWSRQLIWGTHRISGGLLTPTANAWTTSVTWGDTATASGERIAWGTVCGASCENIVWGTTAACDPAIDPTCENIVWGTTSACNPVLDPACENIVWGTTSDENIVWGTASNENIVWGTDCGGADCQNIVWGTFDRSENIVWGTAERGENIVWGTTSRENIVWGTAERGETIVWGTRADGENIVWGTRVGKSLRVDSRTTK
jgi:serine protease AprX